MPETPRPQSQTPPGKAAASAPEPMPESFRRDIGRRSFYLFLTAAFISIAITTGLWSVHDRLFVSLGGRLSPLFIEQDFKDLPALADRLKSSGPLVDYLRQKFTPELKQTLDEYSITNAAQSLAGKLVAELNGILHDPSLYDPARFDGIELSTDLRQLAFQKPSGPEGERVNRLLLEAAFRTEIAPFDQPPKDPSTKAFWAYKLLYEGIITYSIIAAILTAFLYGLGLFPVRLIAFGFPVKKDVDLLHTLLDGTPHGSVASLPDLGGKAGVRPDGRLMARLQMLDRACQTTRDKETLRSANDRLTSVEEAGTMYALQPLVYLEWLLPILGFLGTVWGVTEAVDGLRSGIYTLFQSKALTEAVLQQFMLGFKGLVLAFDTTLFGLIGLGLAGTVNFFMRKSANYALLNIDKWCNEAISRLQEEPDPLEQMLRAGLFQTDKEGKLLLGAEGKPIFVLEELLRTGLFVTNAKGELVIDEKDKMPVLRLKELLEAMQEMVRKGFFVTGEKGDLAAGADGKPILRWQEWMNQLARGLFVTDANGNLVSNPHDRSPISRSAAARRQIVRMLVNDIYEVTPQQAEAVAEGELEGSGEKVPLRNRHERRHRELLHRMEMLAFLLDRALARAGASSSPGGQPPDGTSPPDPASFLVLQPTGLPVDALTVTDSRFAVARQAAPASESDFRIHTGNFTAHLGGRYRQPVVSDDLAAPERVVGLSGLGDRLAYLCGESGELAVRGWEAREFPSSCCLNGGAQPVKQGVVLMPFQKMEQIVVGAQTDKEAQLLSWPADGSGPAPQPIKKMRGQISVFAGLPGRAAACVIGHDDGYKLCLLREGVPQENPIDRDVTALAFAPDGTLWFAEQDGQVGIFNTNTRKLEPRFDFKRRLKLLAATAGGQIVAAEHGTPELFVADTGGQQAHALRCQNPLTALAASPDGQHLLLGHQDGSVFYMDTRQKI